MNRLYDNLVKAILEYMRGRRYKPLTQSEIIKNLGIAKQHKEICIQALSDLIQKETIQLKNRRYSLKEAQKGPKGASKKIKKEIRKPIQEILTETVTGIIRVHQRGFGFLQPDHISECPEEVFIPKHLTDNAVDGDHVEVEINPHSNSAKGPEGKIVAVLKRGRTHLAGIVHRIDPKAGIFVHCPLLGVSKPVIAASKKKLKVGDRVILKVANWGDEDKPTRGEVSHLLGHISDPSVDNQAAIEEYDLRHLFPKPAVSQAEKWGKEVSKKDLKNREDLSKLKTVTIDPETAKDFDDALSLSKDTKGHYHLAVHIADVSHYIPASSPLDKEASERCNSTYFPGFCLPMLPHELSDNLCSLKPDVIRLTVSVLMEFDQEGTMVNYRIARTYIKSNKRFTYEEAKEVLDGKKKSPHANLLKLMVELCHQLKKKRYARGSIDFALPELVIRTDDKGMPQGTKFVEYDITHQLVEEFMLKANEVVARHLSNQGKPTLFRIHEEPSEENIEDFYSLARTLGFALPPKPSQADLQQLFEKAKSTPYGQQLSVGFIRSMKLAYYSADNVGHFGLALDYYCHFTSPIRRYTDLIIQRLLFNEEEKDLDIEKIALKCSEQERVSFRAENSVKTLKKLRLLHRWMQEDPQASYAAIITRVKPFGLFFEIPTLMLEGFLHISELEDDYFLFNQQTNTLVGRHSNKTHAVGQSLTVRPISLDLILLESKWELITKRPRRTRTRL